MRLHHESVARLFVLVFVKRLACRRLPMWPAAGQRDGCEALPLEEVRGPRAVVDAGPITEWSAQRGREHSCRQDAGAGVPCFMGTRSLCQRHVQHVCPVFLTLAFFLHDCRRKPKSWQRSRRTCKYGPSLPHAPGIWFPEELRPRAPNSGVSSVLLSNLFLARGGCFHFFFFFFFCFFRPHHSIWKFPG